MLRRNTIAWIAIILLVAMVSPALATDVSGEITTQTWTKASSPYHVISEVTVPVGHTLTIEPGVDVLFDEDVN